MNRKTYSLLPLVAITLFSAAPVVAQNPHVGHVADGFRGTPDGVGLLPAALAEAEVAAQHAGLAARDLEDLASMKRHVAHVLHAVDPSKIESGPGAGYGVVRAASGVKQHIELAAGVDGAASGVTTHAPHIASAAQNTVVRAEQIAELAAQVAAASSAAAAAPMVTEINTLAGQLIEGNDANGDGRVGWQENEGGLAVAEQHLGLLQRG